MTSIKIILEKIRNLVQRLQVAVVKGIEKYYFYKESDSYLRDETDEFLTLFRPTCWVEFWRIVVLTTIVILGFAVALYFKWI